MYAENLAKMSMPAVLDSGCRAPSLTYLANIRKAQSQDQHCLCTAIHSLTASSCRGGQKSTESWPDTDLFAKVLRAVV